MFEQGTECSKLTPELIMRILTQARCMMLKVMIHFRHGFRRVLNRVTCPLLFIDHNAEDFSVKETAGIHNIRDVGCLHPIQPRFMRVVFNINGDVVNDHRLLLHIVPTQLTIPFLRVDFE